MRSSLFTFVAAVCLASSSLVGCAATEGDATATETSNVEESALPEAIVIQQAERVVSVKVGRDGDVLGGVVKHAFLAAGRELHAAWERAEGEASCKTPWMETNGEWSTLGLSLVGTDGAEVFALTAAKPAPGEDEVMSLTHATEITGNVGPYLFLAETSGGMACGAAHGSFSRTASIKDLRTGDDVIFVVTEEAAAKARAELEGKGFPGEDVTLAEIVPQLDEDAHLTLAYRFEKAAPYVESDGRGNAYSVSAVIDSSSLDAPLPAPLEPLRTPPPAVKAYLATHPNLSTTNPIKGWSTK
ncbi:MAG: hypothetical protein KIT84_41220 [Labilithrix sp.]|nr:hypothetical protein [Labilithrix sp.]MCW5817492.1 hypothetical protein [Labilithrix sp.]